MTAVTKAALKYDQLKNEIDLPKYALDVLNLLDELENFTIDIRKQIYKEIQSSSLFIHVKLDSV